MRKILHIAVVAGMLTALMAAPALANGKSGESSGRAGSTLTVTVTGGDYDVTYDSIVVTDLPAKGPFQILVPHADGSLTTEFGPGDVGYRGGRWHIDVNGNGVIDEGELTFLCPLLGPGQ